MVTLQLEFLSLIFWLGLSKLWEGVAENANYTFIWEYWIISHFIRALLELQIT